MLRLFFAVSILFLTACGGGHTEMDGGPVPGDGGLADAAHADAGSVDAGRVDGGSVDAGSGDAGSGDAGSGDAGSGDAASADAGTSDAGSLDGSVVDAGTLDAATGDGGTCSILGDYSITFMGMTAFFRFGASGMWAGGMTRADLDAPDAFGPYSLSGATLTISENDGTASCPASAVGTYTISLDASCELTLTLITDSCAPRGTVLGSGHFVRLP